MIEQLRVKFEIAVYRILEIISIAFDPLDERNLPLPSTARDWPGKRDFASLFTPLAVESIETVSPQLSYAL
jgi:hypothetical protein